MHRPDLLHQIPPLAYEGGDLLGFLGHGQSEVHQNADLAFHEPSVRIWDHPAVHHCPVSAQGLAGLDNAGVGFGGGHWGTVS